MGDGVTVFGVSGRGGEKFVHGLGAIFGVQFGPGRDRAGYRDRVRTLDGDLLDAAIA